jgi:hypothetical protein
MNTVCSFSQVEMETDKAFEQLAFNSVVRRCMDMIRAKQLASQIACKGNIRKLSLQTLPLL